MSFNVMNNTSKTKGILVVAPPGSGKSYWLSNNKNTKWQEGDTLYKGDTKNLNMDIN